MMGRWFVSMYEGFERQAEVFLLNILGIDGTKMRTFGQKID